MSSMVLRWSTSKIVFSDPDLGSKWLPSADIVYNLNFNQRLSRACIVHLVIKLEAQLSLYRSPDINKSS
jgi:hypothetical protein